MFTTIFEVARITIGVTSGVLAMAFLWTSIRGWRHGASAFEVNRKETEPSIWKTLKGEMRSCDQPIERRAKLGLAFDIKSRKLLPQRQLSNEAIRDVIGRRV